VKITLRHLLGMYSGIPGDNSGIRFMFVEPGVNEFEAALGRFPFKSEG